MAGFYNNKYWLIHPAYSETIKIIKIDQNSSCNDAVTTKKIKHAMSTYTHIKEKAVCNI